MAYGKKDLLLYDRESLLHIIEELQLKLKKRNVELNLSRTKLRLLRGRVVKMKGIVEFQRKRILELYS
jgi:hypothetical protein